MGFILGWGASAFYPSSARHCYPCAKPWHGGLCGYRGWSCHLFYSHWEGSKASMGAFSEASRLGFSREINKMPSGSFGAPARRGLDSVNWRFREFLDPLIKIRHSFSGSTVEICLWRNPVGTAPTGEWSLFIDRHLRGYKDPFLPCPVAGAVPGVFEFQSDLDSLVENHWTTRGPFRKRQGFRIAFSPVW